MAVPVRPDAGSCDGGVDAVRLLAEACNPDAIGWPDAVALVALIAGAAWVIVTLIRS